MKERNDALNSVILPEDAAMRVREACGLSYDSELRILFFGGPGDVVGTFNKWINGSHDPRTPVIAYSSMFFTLVRMLSAKGYILTEHESKPSRMDEQFSFIYVPHGRQRRKLGYWIDEYRFYRDAWRSIQNISPNIVIVDGLAPTQLLSALTKKYRVIVTLHNAYWPLGQRPKRFRDRFRQARRSFALQGVTSAVCTSTECARQLVELGMPAEKCLVEMPQVLDRHVHKGRSDETRIARRLVYLGRIEPEKGILDLVTAFERLAEEFPDLTLDIAGTGSIFSELKVTVSQSLWASQITLHGLLDAAQVHKLLDDSDLLVCPTNGSEGLALVVIEAAVHNVPSIVSSNVPAQELFPNGSVVFQAGSVDDLVECLRKILSDNAHYRELKNAVGTDSDRFFDRSLSWGSMIYRAMIM